MTPYTYIQCPCSDPSTLTSQGRASATDAASPTKPEHEEDDGDDRTFDPRAPRSNYSLYPIEHLLYCEDCHQIRCPRCIAEEVVTYFCPNCLFEVASSNIKSEGNRCTRNCFQCPICVGPLTVTSLESSGGDNPSAGNATPAPHGGPYVLSCNYCSWSSREIDIVLEKPNGVHSQLARLRNGGRPRLTPKERKEVRRKDSATAAVSAAAAAATSSSLAAAAEVGGGGGGSGGQNGGGEGEQGDEQQQQLDIETQFANLKAFYQGQISETTSAGGVGAMSGLSGLGDLGFSSPGSLSRLMSLYTGGGAGPEKRHKPRVSTMREARDADEGLNVLRHSSSSSASTTAGDGKTPRDGLDERAAIAKLQRVGWEGTASSAMQTAQVAHLGSEALHGRSRFQDELRPVPFLLRTKRSKRCPVCRHIITKPESKVASVRFRIRLVASSYIPTISVRPLVTNPAPAPAPPPPPYTRRSATGQQATLVGGNAERELLLKPLEPVQFLLTFKNPIFEPVRVSLATPAHTPGRFASRVTVLCPQFEIGANTDVWDEALREGGAAAAAAATTTATDSSSTDPSGRRRAGTRSDGEGGGQTVEAGKIWARGRNWVTVVVELEPPSLRLDLLGTGAGGEEQVDRSPLREDEDLVEIPMFVRVEWETDSAGDDVGHAPGKDNKDGREKRELAYWVVVGVGRIGPG